MTAWISNEIPSFFVQNARMQPIPSLMAQMRNRATEARRTAVTALFFAHETRHYQRTINKDRWKHLRCVPLSWHVLNVWFPLLAVHGLRSDPMSSREDGFGGRPHARRNVLVDYPVINVPGILFRHSVIIPFLFTTNPKQRLPPCEGHSKNSRLYSHTLNTAQLYLF